MCDTLTSALLASEFSTQEAPKFIPNSASLCWRHHVSMGTFLSAARELMHGAEM